MNADEKSAVITLVRSRAALPDKKSVLITAVMALSEGFPQRSLHRPQGPFS